MFGISVSGIKNSQKHIDVTSNNIANSNTYGFKKSRAEFADVYTNSVFSNNRTAAGMGVHNTVVSQQFAQGNLSGDTGNSLDMAIQGNGFFVLSGSEQTGAQVHTYTRNGAFQVDKNGFIVTATGQYLQGWDVNSDGSSTSLDLNSTHAIKLPEDSGAPKMSEFVGIGVNFPGDKGAAPVPDKVKDFASDNELTTDQIKYGVVRDPATGAILEGEDAKGVHQYYTTFDPKNPNTYTCQTSQTIHDSLGRAHTLTYYMIKVDSPTQTESAWNVIPFVDGEPVDVAQVGDENPIMMTVSSSTSSVNGANFFGFQVKFDGNGDPIPGGQIPSSINLVNPQAGEGTGEDGSIVAVGNSLRHQLFGVPGSYTVNKETGAIEHVEGTPEGAWSKDGKPQLDATFIGKVVGSNGNFSLGDSLYPGSDGSLFKNLGVGINPNQNLNISFNATQYGSSNFTVTDAPFNDGYATGVLLGVSVSKEGIIQCEYSNGKIVDVAKVALADFTNVQGLSKIGDTQWRQSMYSGEAIAREANSGSAGSIIGANLEMSNVDLTSELVELIVAQRSYQANSQSLQTQNTVLDSILSIR